MAITVNPFRWSKSAKHDVTLTYSRLTYYDLGPNFLTQGVELLPGEVWQVSKRNSQYCRSYLRKTTGGTFGPPSGARVTDIDLEFCTHIHETLSSNICYGFLEILIWGETVSKRKKTFFSKFSEIFKILKIRDNNFVALLILRHFK